MASAGDIYCKFGIAAEAAQLFETELGTLLLGAAGAEKAWYVKPDPEAGLKLLEQIDRHTLGVLLGRVKQNVGLSDDLVERFASGLNARNRLTHGFFERHNYRMQTDTGRDKMMAELEGLHSELFAAWQLASAMTSMALAHLLVSRDGGLPRMKRELSELIARPVPASPEKKVAREVEIHVLRQALVILGESE